MSRLREGNPWQQYLVEFIKFVTSHPEDFKTYSDEAGRNSPLGESVLTTKHNTVMQVKNQNGEELFLVIITNSKEFNDPLVSLKTWEEAKEMFEKRITERDNESYMVKQITVYRDESIKRLQAQLLCNHKGWGLDYFECIKVEKA